METNTQAKLIRSLIAARKKINDPFKNRDAQTAKYSYGFADLDEVLQCVTGPCLENGIFISQRVKADLAQATVVTVLMHESGETICSDGISIQTPRNDPQGIGIAVSYARRYDLLSFFGLAQTDEDGKNRFAATVPQAVVDPVAKAEPSPAVQSKEPVTADKQVPGTQSSEERASIEWINRVYTLIESKKLDLKQILNHFQVDSLEGLNKKKVTEIGTYVANMKAAA